MTSSEVISLPVKIIPTRIYLGSYVTALDPDMLKYTVNTLIVILVNIIAIPLSASLCAFGFARVKFKGRDIWFAISLATIMLPSIVLQIPLYTIYVKIGWLNTLAPLTVPSFFGGGALNIFLIRQFMKGLPFEIDNAAKIDGANLFQIYYKIILPLCKPILMFVAVNTFLGVWNDFMNPLIYLKNPQCYTLAVGIYNKFMTVMSLQSLPNIEMATGVLLLLPCLVIFSAFQKVLIDGVTFTGLKG